MYHIRKDRLYDIPEISLELALLNYADPLVHPDCKDISIKIITLYKINELSKKGYEEIDDLELSKEVTSLIKDFNHRILVKQNLADLFFQDDNFQIELNEAGKKLLDSLKKEP